LVRRNERACGAWGSLLPSKQGDFQTRTDRVEWSFG
jgi:hypothetical protein